MSITINTLAVCGAGTMGAGIAQCAAQHGIHVILYDVHEPTLLKAQATIQASLDTLVTKGKLTQPNATTILQRLQYVTDAQQCIADVIIEAIVEKLDVKVALLNQLAEINHAETILATNTSSLSIAAIANGVLHPQRVVGMHFFNPATVMKLVEVIYTAHTSQATLATIQALATILNKTTVTCADAPGFIVNRVARHYYLQAMHIAVHEQVSYQVIDSLLQSVGFKLGPFKLMDLIGNDINYAVTEGLYQAFDQAVRFTPAPLQYNMVKRNKLGQKSGEGFYTY